MSPTWKQRLAGLVRFRLAQRLMMWGIRVSVPRQRIGVAMVVFDEQGRVLMLRHVFHPYTPWGLPGGWLGRNEDPRDGVLRELKEETGLEATLEEPVDVAYSNAPPHVGVIYRGRIRPGRVTLSPEILEAGWFMPDSLPGPLRPSVQRAIRRAAQPHALPAGVEGLTRTS